MYLKSKAYIISTCVKNNYIPASNEYSIVLNPNSRNSKEFSNTLIIKINNRENTTTDIAFVGDYLSFGENCAILDDHILTVLQNTYITQIDLKTNQIILHKKIDIFCGFKIYKCFDGYIIYGEIEIIRLDSKFKELWRFSGKDIFVTHDNEIAFELCEDRIKLKDWSNTYYELDLNGNLIFTK